MTAPRFWLFIMGSAYLLARNAPSRLTGTHRCQSSRLMSFTNAMGPAIPALSHRVSKEPQAL